MRRLFSFFRIVNIRGKKLFRKWILCIVFLKSNCGLLMANPQNPVVISGAANFSNTNPSTLCIDAQDKTIINWGSFSIGKGELTAFLQPNSSATVLNRVTGVDLTSILGTLKGNGNVYLLNPNGILIGKGAIVDTAGFLASTLDVLDSDFIEGKDLAFFGNTKNGVVNLGTIQTSVGDIILLGHNVDNQGSLSANLGAVRIGAGSDLLLQVNGEEKLVINPRSSINPQEGTGINNTGSIQAVVAELKADGNPYQYGINHQGTIDATGIVSQNGQVYLQVDDGRTLVSGKVSASNSNKSGGSVRILGNQIGITDSAVIEVSGDFGGGSVLVGGDFQGKNPDILNASQVVIQKGAEINADAYVNGNGGRIIHWSDGDLCHYGSNSAKGGSEEGNGGFVETSGKEYLDYRGFADLTAPNGESGTLLLDPTNLTITNAADSNVPATTPFYPTPTPGTTANLSDATLAAALAASNVIVQTGNDGGGRSRGYHLGCNSERCGGYAIRSYAAVGQSHYYVGHLSKHRNRKRLFSS